jgi:uncharacterized protein (DUF433 family)
VGLRLGSVKRGLSQRLRLLYIGGVKLPVTVDPEVMSGKPVFAGTRVPVDTLIGYVLDGNTLDEFLEDFPTVKREDAVKVLEYANQSLLHPVDS